MLVYVRIGSEELVLTWEAWEARVAAGRIPPDALVRFDAVTEGDFRRADTLELYHAIADARTSAFARRQAQAGPPILTALLVGVQVRIWWLAQIPDVGQTLSQRFTKWTVPVLEDGEVWRLLTMGFVHTSFSHALMNLMWLAYAAFHLERALGRAHLAQIYLWSVLGGSLASTFGSPDTPSLGASGGVFGLIAASVLFGFLRPEILPERSRRVFGFALLPYLVLMFLSGMTNAGTDNWAHFGGLVTGGLVALVADPPGFERRVGWNRRVHIAGVLAAVALLAGLYLGGPRIEPLRSHIDAKVAQSSAATQRARAMWLHETDTAPVQFDVPVGWFPAPHPWLVQAWQPPQETRAWQVTVLSADTPWTPQSLLDKALEGLPTDRVPFDVQTPIPASFAGVEGLHTMLTLHGTPAHQVEVWTAPRGLHGLVVVWLVRDGQADRLSPLRDRLTRSVSWPPSPELEAARQRFDAAPSSPRARRTLLHELARHGLTEEAGPHLTALLAAGGTSSDDDDVLFDVLGWYPQLLQHRDAQLDALLTAQTDPSRIARVADVLRAAQQPNLADALLLLGWFRFPGDTTLRKALRRANLSVALDPAGRPHALVFDRVTGEARTDEERAAWWHPTVPVTLAQAQDLDRRLAQERSQLVEALLAAPEGSDRARQMLYRLVLGHAEATATLDATSASSVLTPWVAQPPAWWDPRLPDPAALLAIYGTQSESSPQP